MSDTAMKDAPPPSDTVQGQAPARIPNRALTAQDVPALLSKRIG